MLMKKKANGKYKARITARGYEQREGEHFDSSDKASPIATDITIRINFTLIVTAGFWTEIVDVRGAYFSAEFDSSHRMYVSVPKGFENRFPDNVVLLLKRTLYGTCQAAIQFWKKLCTVMVLIGAKKRKGDVCFFYAGLLVYLKWVDDILIAGRKENVFKAKKELARHFTLDQQGEMMENVGCQIEHDRKNRWKRVTQPVMVQSFRDEFELPDEASPLPAEVLSRIAGEPLDAKHSSKFRSGTGKLMHMMKWTRHEILSRVRELSLPLLLCI
jgi:hypothetical protein